MASFEKNNEFGRAGSQEREAPAQKHTEACEYERSLFEALEALEAEIRFMAPTRQKLAPARLKTVSGKNEASLRGHKRSAASAAQIDYPSKGKSVFDLRTGKTEVVRREARVNAVWSFRKIRKKDICRWAAEPRFEPCRPKATIH